MYKEAIIVTAYCDTEDKNEVLYNLVKDLRTLDIFILVASHTPIPLKTQLLCDYCLYDKNNVVDLSRGYTHGVAESMLIKQAFQIFKYYGYTDTYKIPYDIDFKGNFTFLKWEKSLFTTAWWNYYNRELGTFGWYGNIDFIENAFIFPTSVDEMFQYGQNIEEVWYNGYVFHGNKMYIYETYDKMFEGVNINIFYNAGKIKKS